MQKAAFQRSRHLAPGDALGKYEVIRQIAVGGMAELYLARTVGIEGFEKLVVIKRILPQYVANSSFVNMFLNEARLAATLHHPNVAQVYDIGVDEGDYFFAMEYVHGEDLDHISIASDEQGAAVALDAALTLVAGLCAGLHYAHDKASPEGKPLQIVHRDVSPSNVLVSYDGAVKLVDFGIARASSRPGTTQGGLKGKIAYMSPEQCRSKATLDRRSDIYSVGTILYQLTTGRMPFRGETEYQILNQIVNEDAPPPTTIVPNYPPALERIVMRALAREPDQRFATALEMQSAVEDFAHDSRLRVSPLVLARLMSTLFPARLEEWAHAKKQGAFFVEQHVVRTLIESGRTPDRSDPSVAARVAAALAEEDDPTHINQSLEDLADEATLGGEPISTEAQDEQTALRQIPTPPQAYPVTVPGTLVTSSAPGSIPTTPPPRAPSQPSQPRAASPVPQAAFQRPGTPTPIPATPFPFLSSTPAQAVPVVIGAPGQVDVTERVRVVKRRETSPTSFVRTEPKRRRVFVFAGLLAVAGGIAAFIVLGGESKLESSASSAPPSAGSDTSAPDDQTASPPTPDPTPTAAEAEPTPAEPAATEPVEDTEIEMDPPEQSAATADDPKPQAVADTPAHNAETKPAADPPPQKSEPVATKTEPVAAPKSAVAKKSTKTTAAKRPKPKSDKPQKKPDAKEQKSWNADSPFMPVRTK